MADPGEFHKFMGPYDVAFPCDLCDFIARGPGPLEDHVREMHAVPVGAAAGVPISQAAGAVPIPRRRGRPKKEQG